LHEDACDGFISDEDYVTVRWWMSGAPKTARTQRLARRTQVMRSNQIGDFGNAIAKGIKKNTSATALIYQGHPTISMAGQEQSRYA